jgi:hypothetical protein
MNSIVFLLLTIPPGGILECRRTRGCAVAGRTWIRIAGRLEAAIGPHLRPASAGA